MGSLIRATNLHGYGALVRELGGDPGPLLRRYGIRPGVELVEDAFVSYGPFARLLETTAEELDCPDFGLRLSAWQGLGILGPVAVIARNSATVLGAFAEIGRYLHVHSPALRLSVAGPGESGYRAGSTTFHFAIEERGLPYVAQSYELSLANGARIGRLLAGHEMRPRVVAFRHGRCGPLAAYEELFGAPVLFEQDWCGIELGDTDAHRPVDNADPATRRIVARYLETTHRAGEELAPLVAELTRRLLPTGTCSAEAIAGHLGLHPRTMQRRLAEEATTFAAILDHERAQQAGRRWSRPGSRRRRPA
ncbi:AraC family transcriptional regulator [Kitasatospora sp. MMS16-BH015]|uniref:AraC family transcriptional regulator n=1 Tax=Kitasatospora sp. MMS16-BH015 TaxID=2018025 RepID=UPI000CA26BCA|nr:AraC family transcriptional regulator [Kitasatospora sp. MMS16-BH015]AUG76038.1 AraC family transcriptional regulator [Kitasatospora sp. MMS16-BH015]